MFERHVIDAQARRLSLYHYLEPFITGRRVLEIGCAGGEGAAQLAERGAIAVLAVDTDAAAVERARARHQRSNLTFRTISPGAEGAVGSGFDLVLLPEAAATLRRPGAVVELRKLLGPRGVLVAVVPSGDAGVRDGMGFYELKDILTTQLSSVRLLGLTPTAGAVVAEFDGMAEEPRIDAGLLGPDDDRPSHYVAVAASADVPPLGRALVRLPATALTAGLRSDDVIVSAAPDLRVESAGEVLRRRLEEALSQAESASRVARAQADEIAELRARLRRSVEDRTLLDDEMAKLRRALAQADESVISLARRTAEGVDELASRLKGPSARPSDGGGASAQELARVRQQLADAEARAKALQESVRKIDEARRAAEQLRDAAQRERERLLEQARQLQEQARLLQQAVDQRDERVARLEGERQEQTWRIAEIEQRLRRSEEQASAALKSAAKAGEAEEANAVRERAMAEFHRAAARHVEEVNALRANVADQAALVSEVEENLAVAERRAKEAQEEVAAMRRSTAELESSDRARRQRLAELEGKLLRFEREKAEAAARPAPVPLPVPAPAPAPAAAPDAAIEAELSDLRQKLEQATQLGHTQEEQLWQAKERLVASQEKIGILENETANLRGQLEAARTSVSSAPEPAASVPHAPEPSPGVLKALEGLASVEGRLRDEAQTLEGLEEAVAAISLHGGVPPEVTRADQTADELQRLHAVVENFRRLAGRLRDEVDGFAMRAAVSSPADIEIMVDQLRQGLTDIEQG